MDQQKIQKKDITNKRVKATNKNRRQFFEEHFNNTKIPIRLIRIKTGSDTNKIQNEKGK